MLDKEFHRIKHLPPYVFEEVNRLKREERAKGYDVIDFGMGNPDLPTPQFIVDKLVATAQDGRTHRYSSSRGITGLRRAQASYYARRFGVKLNPDDEIVVTLGSKEGFANMAQAITAPGDVILVPNPTYPLHAFGFIISGGVLSHIPMINQDMDGFFASLDHACRHSVPAPLALVLNFPSNPTAQVVDLDFYKQVITFAKKYDLIVLSDLAYAEIYFDDQPPPSILQVPDAFERAVEFTSMSKSLSMPGWRMGFAVGNTRLIAALARVKSYLDYGAFTPIQVAATTALNGGDSSMTQIRKIYKKRRDVLVNSFARAQWPIPSPEATMFAWAPLPEKFAKYGSLQFSKLLLEKAHVAVAPGVGFGKYGEGFVRIALVENEHRTRQAARNIRKFLQEHKG